jgi:hypothetical protein
MCESGIIIIIIIIMLIIIINMFHHYNHIFILSYTFLFYLFLKDIYGAVILNFVNDNKQFI